MPNRLQITKGSSTSVTQTPKQITAQGDVKVQLVIIIAVGIVLVLLALAGILAFFFAPADAKVFWGIIGPIITAIITGAFGFLAGKKQTS